MKIVYLWTDSRFKAHLYAFANRVGGGSIRDELKIWDLAEFSESLKLRVKVGLPYRHGPQIPNPMKPLPSNLLHDRLSNVLRSLALAAIRSEEDSEHVHRLRIATRESLAALNAYRTLLPARATMWLRKRLKRIRSATDKARDLDVMLNEYCLSKTAGHRKLTGCLRDARFRAQQPLVKIHERLSQDRRFKRKIKTCINAIRSVPSEQLTAIVMNQAKLAASLLIRAAPGKSDDVDALHQFRIKAKKLRYCLELCGRLDTNEDLQLLYTTTCEIQKHLGIVNDHTVAAERLERIRNKTNSKRLALQTQRQIKRELNLAKQARSHFLSWWNADRLEQTSRLCQTSTCGPDSEDPTSRRKS